MSFKAKLCLNATSTGARGEEDRDHGDQSVRCPPVFFSCDDHLTHLRHPTLQHLLSHYRLLQVL